MIAGGGPQLAQVFRQDHLMFFPLLPVVFISYE
jgi:hypothetical protein